MLPENCHFQALLVLMNQADLNFSMFKVAGGFEALVTEKTTEIQQIGVIDRIVGLERINSMPRPTMSRCLEGRLGSPRLFGTRFLFQSPPPSTTLSKMDVVINDGCATVAASMKLLNSKIP